MNAIVTFLEPVFQWWERFEQADPGTGFMVFVYGAAWLIGWMFTRLQPTRPEAVSTLIIRHSLPHRSTLRIGEFAIISGRRLKPRGSLSIG